MRLESFSMPHELSSGARRTGRRGPRHDCHVRTHLTVLTGTRGSAQPAADRIRWLERSADVVVGVPRDWKPGARLATSVLEGPRPSACPCCYVEPLPAAIRALLDHATALASPLCGLWIEGSGSADLAQAMADLVTDDELAPRLTLAGIVAFHEAIAEHVAIADRVIGPEPPADGWLRGQPLYDDRTGRFDPEGWLPSVAPASAPALEIGLPQDDEYEWSTIERWLERSIAPMGRACRRLKAVLNVRDADAVVAIHALAGRLQAPAWMPRAAIPPQCSRAWLVRASPQPMSPPSTIRFVAVQ
jgi:hypothetical protein